VRSLINRVYTRIGDRGTTRLAGGQELNKCDPRIEAYGTVDELNAVLGVLVETIADNDRLRGTADGSVDLATRMTGMLRRIQDELFDLGGELATLPADRHDKEARLTEVEVQRLEQEIDQENATLPDLPSFVLPGGGLVSAHFHQARTVCRRAERRVVALHETEPQRPAVLAYMNRLSDWLFVLGRRLALATGHKELLWNRGKEKSP